MTAAPAETVTGPATVPPLMQVTPAPIPSAPGTKPVTVCVHVGVSLNAGCTAMPASTTVSSTPRPNRNEGRFMPLLPLLVRGCLSQLSPPQPGGFSARGQHRRPAVPQNVHSDAPRHEHAYHQPYSANQLRSTS